MQKLREYAQDVLNLYNYFNGAIIIDENEKIVYYYNNRSDINDLTEKDVVGKTIFEIYPELNRADSTLIKALKEGESTSNVYQKIVTSTGQSIGEVNTTFPILDGDKIIGAVEVSKYVYKEDEENNIYITPIANSAEKELFTIDDIISNCDEMNTLKKRIKKVARTTSSVLIYGETGTGKEMVAEAIHSGGDRSKNKFVSQNCAAIPANLLESILFGTVKGSFTGAEDRMGILESANGGTVFLDEMNNMDMALQAKLLRVIEEQKIYRVGDFEPIPINIRIIAATNKNPVELVDENLLRRDLYYRLKVVQINILPLRERGNDVSFLVNYFIKKYNKIMNKNIQDVDEVVKELFCGYSWPGNVRELENLIHGAFNFAEGHFIRKEDLKWFFTDEHDDDFFGMTYEKGKTLKELAKEYENRLIKEVASNSSSMNELLEKLDITRQNLNHKINTKELEKNFNMKK